MRPHRYTHRDRNQGQIVRDLRTCGLEIYDISTLSDSQCPGDILVYARGQWQPFEVKTSDGKLSPEQRANVESGKVPVARCAEDVLRHFGMLRE